MNNRIKNTVFCLFCFLLSSVLGLLLVFGEHESFSEKENRALQTFPLLSLQSLSDGNFFSELSDFSVDQFPMRDELRSFSAVCELSLGRLESGGVIVASDGYIISRHDNTSDTILQKNIESINSFFNYTDEKSIPSYILLAPRAIDVMRDKLPYLFPRKYGENEYKTVNKKISSERLIDSMDILKTSADFGNYVWYKTDHHWTSYGAYEAYKFLFERLNKETFPIDSFNVECVSDKFYGTTYSKLSLPFSESDSIYLFRYDGDEKIRVFSPTSNNTTFGFYSLDALNAKDKYRIFLGGNTDLLQIRKADDNGERREKILLIKDSFANSLIPILARHYDIDVIDLRYYKDSLRQYIEKNSFDLVFLVYGIDTLASDSSTIFLSK